ncbi:hypothetical protein [Nocardioides sp.]|uniref:hypothetical protein n=1 Tax=Nocardioides sp. TaxID=35761 RepID=UPI002EDB1F42
MQDWMLLVAAAVLALLAATLGVALLRSRSRAGRAVEAAYAETAALRTRLEELERRVTGPASRPAAEGASRAEFVITHLGEDEQHAPGDPVRIETARIEKTLFADLVLRETVVKAASLAHGVRRALDAETRNRIRFEMRREVKRARKQRRADTRRARREWEARQRSARHDDEDTAA